MNVIYNSNIIGTYSDGIIKLSREAYSQLRPDLTEEEINSIPENELLLFISYPFYITFKIDYDDQKNSYTFVAIINKKNEEEEYKID